jgi:glucose/arabinose dehydrogenase
MRTAFIVTAFMFGTLGIIRAQISANPIPAPIEKRGITVELRDVVRLPETRGMRPPDQDVNPAGWARVSFVRDAPDGRRFVNDSRGFLYLLRDGTTSVYLDFASQVQHVNYSRLESGLIGFTFHPEFAKNGLLYTVHAEFARDNPSKPDFIPPGYTDAQATHHNVITEWRAKNPAANTFEGTRRELLRVAHVVQNQSHPFGAVEFDPTAKPGSEDYGLLYTSGSDLGFSNGGGQHANNPGATQRLDSLIGAILRIDPRSPSASKGTKGLGDYTIPRANRFAGDNDPKTLGEIYAYGFRNAHRLSWDPSDRTMFANDIGMDHIEEVNIVRNGGNYGWMTREGIWENGMNRPGGKLSLLFELPAEILDGRKREEFLYPVAMYDHDEGRAISGGFTYNGKIAALRGKYVFGDVQRGRVFTADVVALKQADDGVPRTVAPIEEVQLVVRDANGARQSITFQELVDRSMNTKLTRADLHLHRGSDGELLISSRQDGFVRMLVP